jgi:hypothetical protein
MAVLVHTLPASSTRYAISLVGTEGRVYQSVHSAKRTPIPGASELPYVSTSRTRLYYLDGDGLVRSVTANSTPGPELRLPGNTYTRAAFAVSPDDSRIAFSLLDYSVRPVKLTLYLAELAGGTMSEPAAIFTATDHYVWPVAWHSGNVVLAYITGRPFVGEAGLPAAGRNIGPNPYGAVSYHIVDPTNADRLVSLDRCTPSGPLGPAGTACLDGKALNWGGALRSLPGDTYRSTTVLGSLSPDGQSVIAGRLNYTHVMLYGFDGSVSRAPNGGYWNDWIGWIDLGHVVVAFVDPYAFNGSVGELSTGQVFPVDANGFFAAVLPTSVE